MTKHVTLSTPDDELRIAQMRIREMSLRIFRLEQAAAQAQAAMAAEMERLTSVVERLARIPAPKRPKTLTQRMAQIAADIAAIEGSTVEAMKGRSRSDVVCDARNAAMSAMEEAGFSTGRIARFFGRDRSTVSHAIRQHRGKMA